MCGQQRRRGKQEAAFGAPFHLTEWDKLPALVCRPEEGLPHSTCIAKIDSHKSFGTDVMLRKSMGEKLFFVDQSSFTEATS